MSELLLNESDPIRCWKDLFIDDVTILIMALTLYFSTNRPGYEKYFQSSCEDQTRLK